MRYGIAPVTLDQQHQLDRELMRLHGLSPYGSGLDAALEQLHVEAFANTKPRPPRLLARDGVVEFEDILVD